MSFIISDKRGEEDRKDVRMSENVYDKLENANDLAQQWFNEEYSRYAEYEDEDEFELYINGKDAKGAWNRDSEECDESDEDDDDEENKDLFDIGDSIPFAGKLCYEGAYTLYDPKNWISGNPTVEDEFISITVSVESKKRPKPKRQKVYQVRMQKEVEYGTEGIDGVQFDRTEILEYYAGKTVYECVEDADKAARALWIKERSSYHESNSENDQNVEEEEHIVDNSPFHQEMQYSTREQNDCTMTVWVETLNVNSAKDCNV